MSDNYDIVIVGAGITGALVAKALAESDCEQVKSILILEAGRNTGATADGYRTYVHHYYEQMAKVPNAPYPNNPDAPSANVLNLTANPPSVHADGYLVQRGPLQFLSDYERAQGGTTLHWLGTCLRMLPNDFHMKTTYGQAVDWPITYQELRPYYERAEREIGVSADVDDQIYPNMGDDYFGQDYHYPMQKIPQSYLDQKFSDGLKGMRIPVSGQEEAVEVYVESTPQGRNSTPNPGYTPVGMVGDPETGQRCEGNSSCTPICPVQAKYNALKTLNLIPRHKLEIRAQCIATRVLIDSASGRISGIEYKRYHDADSPKFVTEKVQAKIYVLAAHAIENAKLLLASNVANSSDQVGRNLMDHLCLLTWGLMPENVGAYRGPGSTSGIPSFRDGDSRRTQSSFRVEIGNWGWNWPKGTPITSVEQFVDQDNLFGDALRKRLAGELPRQFRIAWEVEQLPEQNNRVTIDPQFRDQLGNYRPVIHYDISDYSRAGVAQAKTISDMVFARLGVENFTQYNSTAPGYFTYQKEGYTVNGAGHVVGTHRMGSSKNDSVVDKNQRSWDHENLYIVGCGNMPTLGTSNPTLTAAALSLWAAENILKDLQEKRS